MNKALTKHQPSTQEQASPPPQDNSQQKAFQVMYQALLTIASADAFFDETKTLKRTAAMALADLGRLSAR